MQRRGRKAVSFYHPSASYPDHVLIIPRKVAKNVFCLRDADFIEIIKMAVNIREKDDRDFVLLINGGNKQDVMQAHFHLFTGNLAGGLAKGAGTPFSISDAVFWRQAAFNLRDMLSQSGVSETSFSMLMQFKKGGKPALYFI